MLTGADVRRYRKLLGMTQTAFARQLGLAQTTLSQIEGGRIAVSEDHVQTLTDKFGTKRFKPTFGAYLAEMESQRGKELSAIAAAGHHVTLKVWAWQEGLDLSRPLPPDQQVDLVTARTTGQRVIAFAMPKASKFWMKGEILVFEQAPPNDVHDGDTCLLQVRRGRSRALKAVIAVARLSSAGRERVMQFDPVTPKGPIFTPSGHPLTIFREIYRARHMV